jgi:GDP-D-mannose dehydratase
LLRPTDIAFSAADASLAERELGWKATRDVDDVIRELCGAATGRSLE